MECIFILVHENEQRVLLCLFICRGRESDPRHEALQATALPLSYRGGILKNITEVLFLGNRLHIYKNPSMCGIFVAFQLPVLYF